VAARHLRRAGPWPEIEALGDYSFAAWIRDADAVLAARGVDRPILAGWSYGALVAAHWASRHPDRTLGAVLVDGAYPYDWLDEAMEHSFARLYALTLKIAQQRDTWRDRGINLEMWGPDPSTNKVAVSLESYTSAAAQPLYASYGTSWMSVSTTSSNMTFHLVGSTPQASVNTPLASVNQGRFQDSNPFYGGDYIDNPNTNAACTDGFVMEGATHPANRWLMTSGPR
jgi:pimeloyl-ACP methyl ester carboxylesterase